GTLRVVHTNDSKGAAGSRRDLHEHIGKGTIGLEGFRAVVNHSSLVNVPKILETPKDTEPAPPDGRPWDAVNVETLRALVAGAAPRKPASKPKVARTAAVRPTKKAKASRSKR